MDECRCKVPRKPWELPFLAEASEVAGLRRVMRLHLRLWGLPDLVEAAQLCVSELATNVITHIGPGTQATLGVSMSGAYLRLEIRDPDSGALPTLLDLGPDAEHGRGVGLVDAVTDRWGVIITDSGKTTWCELSTGLATANGHAGGWRVAKAEALLTLYDVGEAPRHRNATPLSLAMAEEAAVGLIGDVLHWLRAHGCDPDETLDRAQMHFEAALKEVA